MTSALGGKLCGDGRKITVRQEPDWDAVRDTPDFEPPADWTTMSDVERAIWMLENSDKPTAQYFSLRAEWVLPCSPALKNNQ